MILIALAAMAVPLLDPAGPLAPARTGQVQCYGPQVEHKTCEAIGSYRFETDGRIVNKAENVLNGAVRAVLHAEGEVFIRDGAECSSEPLASQHILSIEIDGEALTGDDFEVVRENVVTAVNQAVGDGEYCTTYHPKPDGSMVALVTVAGKPRPDLTSIVRWVRREEGWRLQP